MARVNTNGMPTPPRSSHISVGMHPVQGVIDVLNWGQPIGEDLNVSSVNTIQVLKRKRIGMCLVQYA